MELRVLVLVGRMSVKVVVVRGLTVNRVTTAAVSEWYKFIMRLSFAFKIGRAI